MAELLTSPQWQLFTRDQMDLSTVEKEFVEYRESNVTGASALSRFQLETRDKDAFLLPSEGYIEVRYQMSSTEGTFTALPASEEIALQNSAVSLFKKTEFALEDQVIESNDNPGLSHLVKNISDFSKQYGESIAANEHFYLDNKEHPYGKKSGLRFFNNTAPRVGYELFFVSNGTNYAATVAGSAATWQNGDAIEAKYDDEIVLPYATVKATTVETESAFTITGAGLLTVAGITGNTIELVCRLSNSGEEIRLYRDGVGFRGQYQAAGLIDAGATVGAVLSGAPQTPVPDRYNSGFSKRSAVVSGGKLATAFIPLKHLFLFCRSFDKVSRGLRIRVTLERNTDSEMILRGVSNTATNAARYVIVQYISMWIPRVKPDLATLKMVNDNLQSNELFDVNFTDLSHFKSATALTATGQQSLQISTTSKKPIRVWVTFQKAARVSTSQLVNKRVFDFLGMNSIQVRLNNKIFPAFEYKFGAQGLPGVGAPATEDIGIARAYNALMNSAYKMRGADEGSLITPDQWKSLYPIYYFDLTHQDEDLYKATKTAELEVRWDLASPGTGYFVNVFYESERLVKFKGVSGSLAIVM